MPSPQTKQTYKTINTEQTKTEPTNTKDLQKPTMTTKQKQNPHANCSNKTNNKK